MYIEFFQCHECDEKDFYNSQHCSFPGCPKEHEPYTEMIFVKPRAPIIEVVNDDPHKVEGFYIWSNEDHYNANRAEPYAGDGRNEPYPPTEPPQRWRNSIIPLATVVIIVAVGVAVVRAIQEWS